jgi:uncharacterized membrane protein YgcG
MDHDRIWGRSMAMPVHSIIAPKHMRASLLLKVSVVLFIVVGRVPRRGRQGPSEAAGCERVCAMRYVLYYSKAFKGSKSKWKVESDDCVDDGGVKGGGSAEGGSVAARRSRGAGGSRGIGGCLGAGAGAGERG